MQSYIWTFRQNLDIHFPGKSASKLSSPAAAIISHMVHFAARLVGSDESCTAGPHLIVRGTAAPHSGAPNTGEFLRCTTAHANSPAASWSPQSRRRSPAEDGVDCVVCPGERIAPAEVFIESGLQG